MPQRLWGDYRRAYRYALPYRLLSAGMRLRNFAEAFTLRDEGALEKAGEDAAGRAEQPENEEG